MISGKQIAKSHIKYIKHDIQTDIRPIWLAIIQISHDKGSSLYIKMIKRACHQVNIHVKVHHMITHDTRYPNGDAFHLHRLIDMLNENPKITGILVAKPYDSHIDSNLVDTWIKPYKDIDGTSVENMGNLFKGLSGIRPATPEAVLELLMANQLYVTGKSVAIINRSQIIGQPLTLMLIQQGAEVMVFNHYMDIEWLRDNDFDIVIAGTGEPDIITRDFVHTDQTLIPISEIPKKDGIHGDFSKQAMNKAKTAFKPTGNIGPLCIYNIISNCLQAYNWQSKLFLDN